MQAAKTAPYLYDAVWLYAHALNRTLTQGGNISDGVAIFRNGITTTPLFTGTYFSYYLAEGVHEYEIGAF